VAVILSTMPATRTVAEACRELGIGPTQFDTLRMRALEGAVQGMAPRPTGRPRLHARTAIDVEALQRENAELRRENAILQARLELAVLPRAQEAPRPKSAGRTMARGPRPLAAAGRAVP
jgi:transposase-like protein